MIGSSNANKHARWPVVTKALLFILGCAVASAVAAPFTRNLSVRWPEFIVGVIGSLWALGLTLVFVRWDEVCLDDVGAKPDRLSLARLVVGFLIGTGMVALWMSISMATGYVHWERAPENGAVIAAITLIAYLALASREELAFHGYPLRRLEQSFGVWGAQLIVALVFALEHMVGGWSWTRALFGAGVGSLLFGMAAIATRGLAVPIGLHAAWNFGQSMMGLNGEPALWRAVVDNGQEQYIEHVRTISYVAVMGSATLAFWFWHRKTNLSALPD
jgi:uncharacterized protein